MNSSAVPQPSPVSAPARPARQPTLRILIATACGLGYLPKAPGTWGSLGGLFIAAIPWLFFRYLGLVSTNTQILSISIHGSPQFDPYLVGQICIAVVVAAAGVWSASTAARYWAQEDPQRVVIDEVSGQHIALLLGCGVPIWWRPVAGWIDTQFGFVTLHSALNWKYLLVGFILFRAFDIWKPFPAREAERLHGGWGIMADDWIAGIYAAIGLWIARAAGL